MPASSVRWPSLLLATLVALVAGLQAASSQAATRGDSPSERKRTAVEICARELRQRENARDVRVDRTIRNSYDNDKVTWQGYMTAQRNGPDRTVQLDCVVDFKGSNRIVRFDTHGGGGWGGGGSGGSDRASRACWSEAERRGYDVGSVEENRDVDGWGRLVLLRVDGRRQLMCLYRGSPSLFRPA